MAELADQIRLLAEGQHLEWKMLADEIDGSEPPPPPVPEPVPVPEPIPVPSPGSLAAEITKALNQGKVWTHPGGRLTLEQPVALNIAGEARDDELLGIDGRYGSLYATFPEPMFSINIAANVHGFVFKNLMLHGTNRSAGGLHMSVTGNVLLSMYGDLLFKSFKGRAFSHVGASFESSLLGYHAMDCDVGMYFSHLGSRHVSAFEVDHFHLVQCRVGVIVDQEARDIDCGNGYIRDCRGPAAILTNGTDRVWYNINTENCCLTEGEAHFQAENQINLEGCSFNSAKRPDRLAVLLTGRAASNPSELAKCRGSAIAGVRGLVQAELYKCTGLAIV